MNRVRRNIVALLAGLLCIPAAGRAQLPPVAVSVRVVAGNDPVSGAQVSLGGTGGVTGSDGVLALRVPAGAYTLRVEKLGLEAVAMRIEVPGRDTTFLVELHEEALEHEPIIVSSTRSDRRIEDEPLRVEVVSREEVEEKLLMTPGDIAMLLNETGGLRVQPTAPALGGASVRIQGMRGRYTQVLSDALPLYGGQTGALGPLQIPPMDLGQVEVIKGVASALYGASALGGVVNLISRRPGEEREREVLLNQSTLGGSDAIFWDAHRLDEAWGYTLLASAHRQGRADVDDDGWADLPAFRRIVLRPRLFWSNAAGASVLLTAGGMAEDREGGMDGAGDVADYREAMDTRRADLGGVARLLIAPARLLSVRGSGTLQRHDHGFGARTEKDVHGTAFAELALSGSSARHTWVIGAALQHESYDVSGLDGFDYAHTTPGIFVQDEFSAGASVVLSGSARLDRHSEYGTFLNPRLSVLVRPGTDWTVRASAGSGFFAPTPWTEEVEAVGLGRVASWSGLDAETAQSASLDVSRILGPLELNATLFGSSIENAVQARYGADASALELVNAPARVRTYGTELLGRYHRDGLHITASYIFMRATEPDPESGARREVPLTPRHAAGLVAAWEVEDRGRVGIELYYTGRQEVDENPYRTATPAYFITGLLVERRFGGARLFVNAENLLDTRQTRHDPLLLPAPHATGRRITDVWGPLEGRAFNAGVRLSF